MNRVTRNRIFGLLLAGAIYLLDQWIKRIVDADLSLKLGQQVEITPFFNLTRTHNYGISLGMFEATSPEMRWGLVLLTSIIAMVVFIWMMRERNRVDIFGLALILGGALGNITDRVRYGYVLDYADLHFGDFRPFLIFNLADAAITIGVLIILARSFFSRDKGADKTNKTAGDPAAES